MHFDTAKSLIVWAGLVFVFPAYAQESPSDPSADRLRTLSTEHLETLGERLRPGPDAPFPEGTPFAIEFASSVDGLEAGAPVVVLGLRVGTVREVSVEYDSASRRFVAPVLVDIVPSLLAIDGRHPATPEATEALVAALVERGLRARVGQAGLLEGSSLVALEIEPDAAPAPSPAEGEKYPTIPAAPDRRAELRAALDALVLRVEKLPLDTIAQEALATLRDVREVLAGEEIEQALAKLSAAAGRVDAMAAKVEGNTDRVFASVSAAAGEAERSAAALRQSLGPRAPLWGDLERLLSETANTLRSLRLFVDYLERHPEALLTGKPE